MSIVLIDDIQPGGAFKLVDVADLTPDVDTDGLVLTGDGAGNVGMEAASAHGDHHAQVHEIDGHDAATPLSVAKGGTGSTTFPNSINFVIDGGGSVITPGIKGTVHIDFACAIVQWKIEADQSGSIVVDVNKATPSWTADVATPSYASIAGSELPTLVSQVEKRDTSLSTWTTAIAADEQLQFEVDSVTTCTRVTISLKIQRT